MLQKQRVSAHIGGQHKDPMWLTEYPKTPNSAPPPNSCIQVSICFNVHSITIPLRTNTIISFCSLKLSFLQTTSEPFKSSHFSILHSRFITHRRCCGFSKIFNLSYKSHAVLPSGQPYNRLPHIIVNWGYNI